MTENAWEDEDKPADFNVLQAAIFAILGTLLICGLMYACYTLLSGDSAMAKPQPVVTVTPQKIICY